MRPEEETYPHPDETHPIQERTYLVQEPCAQAHGYAAARQLPQSALRGLRPEQLPAAAAALGRAGGGQSPPQVTLHGGQSPPQVTLHGGQPPPKVTLRGAAQRVANELELSHVG